MFSFSLSELPATLYQLPLKQLNIGGCKKLPLNTVNTICENLAGLEELDLAGERAGDAALESSPGSPTESCGCGSVALRIPIEAAVGTTAAIGMNALFVCL